MLKLATALDEFGLRERRRRRGEEGRRTAAALAALREYLLEYAALEESGDVSPRDLSQFLLEYYPSQEEPDPEVALALLEVTHGFALWLVEQGERPLAPFAEAGDRLREDLPRVLSAFVLMRDHTRRDDVGGRVDLTDESGRDGGDSVESGVHRVARLSEIDYAAAEEEYFTIRSVQGVRISATSREREALGEGPIDPLLVPEEAARLLRPGDIIHVEIAPGPHGWELLEVFGIRPGGYA